MGWFVVRFTKQGLGANDDLRWVHIAQHSTGAGDYDLSHYSSLAQDRELLYLVQHVHGGNGRSPERVPSPPNMLLTCHPDGRRGAHSIWGPIDPAFLP